MLTEKQINALPERIYKTFADVNTYYLEKIGKRIGQIGKMNATQANQLLQLKEYGADINDIKRKIARAAEKSQADLEEIFKITAKDNYEFSEKFYKAKDVPYPPISQNESLQQIIQSYIKQTSEYIFGIAQTTAFAKWDETLQDFVLSDLSEAYQSIIERSVMAVNMGVTDYQSAMRDTIKELSQKGIRTVDYATGYSRRLDTAVRQNILWGVKQCNQETQNTIGNQFGADGVEVSYHSNPRPSHGPMGGKQFSTLYEPAKVDGKTYPSFYQPYGGYGAPADLLQEYNCLHFTFPIILGVSEPNWDSGTLEAYKRRDNRTFEYEGKKYTGYQATQMQRKLETAIRRQKDLANAAKAAGDDVLRRQAQSRINTLETKYADFSRAANLSVKENRKSVAGFRPVSVANPQNSDIINTYKGKGIPVQPNISVSDETIKRINKATEKVTSDFKALELQSEPIAFGSIDALAENRFDPTTGRNQIKLNKSAFSDPESLLHQLKEDFINGESYETDSIESLIAHEMGHNAHNILALKRAGLDYGKPLSPIQQVIFENERNKISQEIYLAAFSDESLSKIYEKCIQQLGRKVYKNPEELIAQSFGNYYFGNNKSLIAKNIVKYFKKELK